MQKRYALHQKQVFHCTIISRHHHEGVAVEHLVIKGDEIICHRRCRLVALQRIVFNQFYMGHKLLELCRQQVFFWLQQELHFLQSEGMKCFYSTHQFRLVGHQLRQFLGLEFAVHMPGLEGLAHGEHHRDMPLCTPFAKTERRGITTTVDVNQCGAYLVEQDL